MITKMHRFITSFVLLTITLTLTSFTFRNFPPINASSGADFSSIIWRAVEPDTNPNAYYGDGSNTYVRTELQAEDYVCGDVVPFLIKIDVDANPEHDPQSIEIDLQWLCNSTGQGGVGVTDVISASINPASDPGVSSNGNETVMILSETITGDPLDVPNGSCTLDATLKVDGINGGESIVVRIDVLLECDPTSTPTGNIQASLMAARVVSPVEDAIAGGQQTINWKVGGICFVNISDVVVTHADCNQSNGMITITANSSVKAQDSELRYSIDGINYQASNVFSGLAPGTYTIYVWESTVPNCISTQEVEIMGLSCTPSIACGAGQDYGCQTSPPTLPAQFSDITVHEDCGGSIDVSENTVTVGCDVTLTRTYTPISACGNGTPCDVVYTWVEDNGAPTTTTCNEGNDFGCQSTTPNITPIPPTWVDACGFTAGQLAGTPTNNGCNWSVTHKFWADDECGNTSDTCYQTFTWIIDNGAPTTTTCNEGNDFGCQSTTPNITPIPPTWVDACGFTAGQLAGTPTNNGCNWSVTHKFWADDECGNTSDTCYQTFTWIIDNGAPTTTTCNEGNDFGCQSTTPNITPIPPTWVDACGFTAGQLAGTPTNNGCNWSVTHKFWADDR